MLIDLAAPYRLSLRLPQNQKVIYAQAAILTFEVPELTGEISRYPFISPAGKVGESVEHEGTFYRQILDRGLPVAKAHLATVSPERLFYNWSMYADVAFEEHPLAVNLTFARPSVATHPDAEGPPDSGRTLLDAIERREMDQFPTEKDLRHRLDGYAIVDGELVRPLERQTIALRPAPHGYAAVSSDARADERPFAIHFGEEQRREGKARLAGLPRTVEFNDIGVFTGSGYASQHVANRRTLISATAAVLNRLDGMPFRRIAHDELDLVVRARDALLGINDPWVNASLLRSMRDVLPQSLDLRLRRMGEFMARFLPTTVDPDIEEDEDLERGVAELGSTSRLVQSDT